MGPQTIIVAVCVAVLICLPFVLLYARRRWLTGQGGLFDCACRITQGPAASGWVLGLARYRGDELEWYRVFSLAIRPSWTLRRELTVYANQRSSDGLESVVLFDESRIVTLRDRSSGQERVLAMEPDAAMGLMSWLESAPPGTHFVPRSADSPS